MMKHLTALLASVALVGPVAAYANTNARAKVYIATVAQNDELVQADYEALTWVEIKGIGSHGETGVTTNILSYDTWDTDVTQKAKGITDAGSPEIELARIALDPGQLLLRNAANNNLNYAFKMVRNDPITEGGVGTILYNRGLVVGPRRPHGRNEDFDLEVFTVGLQQREIVVAPGDGGVAPTISVLPAITGTAEVGETLTVSTGTWAGDATILYTYQWYAAGVLIVGATANTYELTSDEVGKIIQARVHASNDAGSAAASSNATAAVIA